jgi:hypothetical protein
VDNERAPLSWAGLLPSQTPSVSEALSTLRPATSQGADSSRRAGRQANVRRFLALLVVLFALVAGCGDEPREAAARDEVVKTSTSSWQAMATSPLIPRHGAVVGALGEVMFIGGGRSTAACPPNASCAADSTPALQDAAL